MTLNKQALSTIESILMKNIAKLDLSERIFTAFVLDDLDEFNPSETELAEVNQIIKEFIRKESL